MQWNSPVTDMTKCELGRCGAYCRNDLQKCAEDYGNGGNYISSLKPGESIQVNMAWIVNENDLADMYLNLDGEGGAYDFNEGMLEAGVVDIK